MGFPAGVLLPVFLLGVIAVDLTFDIGGLPPATTVTYYAGHRTAGFPANTFIILAIAVGSIPYVRALMRPQLTDIISFGVLIVSFIAFVGYLIPVQEELIGYVTTPTAPRAVEIMEGVKLVHFALAACMFLAIWLQTTKTPIADGKKTK